MATSEFSVHPVIRYVISHFYEDGLSAGMETYGEFDHLETATEVAKVLAEAQGGTFRPHEPPKGEYAELKAIDLNQLEFDFSK